MLPGHIRRSVDIFLAEETVWLHVFLSKAVGRIVPPAQLGNTTIKAEGPVAEQPTSHPNSREEDDDRLSKAALAFDITRQARPDKNKTRNTHRSLTSILQQ